MNSDQQGVEDVHEMFVNESPSATLSQLRPLVSNNLNGSASFGFDATSIHKANLNLIRQGNNGNFHTDMFGSAEDHDYRNGYVSVEGIMALLVESVKEQQELINKLSLRIEELENKNKM